MALEELDLEFEEEEDPKKKKGDGIQLDGTIEFTIDPKKLKAMAGTKTNVRAQDVGTTSNIKIPHERTNVAPIKKGVEDNRTKSHVLGNALKAGPTKSLSEDNQDLREQMRQTQFNADVKVAVAEFKAQLLGEVLGDMKLMEHQIGQLLLRIVSKHSDVKQEALIIKKILADFTTKKRK